MAGAGYRNWTAGDIPTATQFDTFLQEQTVMVFATAAARNADLAAVLAEGMVCYLLDTNRLFFYDGTRWVTAGGGRATYTRASVQAVPAADTTIVLDAEVLDEIGISLAAGVLTLPAGLFTVGVVMTVTVGFGAVTFRTNFGALTPNIPTSFSGDVVSGTRRSLTATLYFPVSGTLELRFNGSAQNVSAVNLEIAQLV